MLTIRDTLGRCWTIVTTEAVVGFRWHVYLHREGPDIHPGALEMIHPGGVAHGWTDSYHEDDRIRALLVAIMGTKGASEVAVSGEADRLRLAIEQAERLRLAIEQAERLRLAIEQAWASAKEAEDADALFSILEDLAARAAQNDGQ